MIITKNNTLTEIQVDLLSLNMKHMKCDVGTRLIKTAHFISRNLTCKESF